MWSDSVQKLISLALQEDDVERDITSSLLLPPHVWAKAKVQAKQSGVLAGNALLKPLFENTSVVGQPQANDGENVHPHQIVATLEGKLYEILSRERVFLNFLMRLSGIATLTQQFVQQAAPLGIEILDTRKTTPGLRELEKYAVRMGGGKNQRLNLSHQILIKENHLAAFTTPKEALKQLYQKLKKMNQNIFVQIEVENLFELQNILQHPPHPNAVLLDNMTPPQIRQAVEIRNQCAKNVLLEVSGGIRLENLHHYLIPGINRISIGSLTHSATALDFSLQVEEVRANG
ncbi:MAG: carboxylating nicotinate-nucleotide diphosphorylase [Planctomycetota bacterium]|nr:MAG: carboxylating nicotinate-nucleotide diphosphorylase [Planctomycetota bacterium]